MLQIRVQRRKRYRTRPLGGYKTLAMGTVEMSQVYIYMYIHRLCMCCGSCSNGCRRLLLYCTTAAGAAGRLFGGGAALLWETSSATGSGLCRQSH